MSHPEFELTLAMRERVAQQPGDPVLRLDRRQAVRGSDKRPQSWSTQFDWPGLCPSDELSRGLPLEMPGKKVFHAKVAEYDLQLLLQHFGWVVEQGEPPTLAVFSQCWQQLSFSYIFEVTTYGPSCMSGQLGIDLDMHRPAALPNCLRAGQHFRSGHVGLCTKPLPGCHELC